MKLVLKNGERVLIHRHNCGYQYQRSGAGIPTVEWNIDPVRIIQDQRSGYFVIGPYGSGWSYENPDRPVAGRGYYDPSKFEKIVPVSSVLYIEDPGKWEKEEVMEEVEAALEMGRTTMNFFRDRDKL